MTDFKMGISAAASWAWGVSLGVSFSILQNMGVESWLAWAAVNTIALAVFGAFVTRYPNYLRLRRNSFVNLAMVGIQVFCVWINVKIMAAYVGPMWASVAALVTFLLTYRWKLPYSVGSDQWQYAAMVGALALIFASGRRDMSVLTSMPVNPKWLIPACVGLACGPFIDGQHFQRAELMAMRGWIIGSLAFGIYLSLVFLAYVTRSALASAMLAVTVIAVATSTLDSSVASLQDLIGDRWAIVVSMAAFLSWPLFESRTAVQIWTWYATGRIFVVVPMIVYAVREAWRHGRVADRALSARR